MTLLNMDKKILNVNHIISTKLLRGGGRVDKTLILFCVETMKVYFERPPTKIYLLQISTLKYGTFPKKEAA